MGNEAGENDMPALPRQREGFRLLQMERVKRALLPARDASGRLPGAMACAECAGLGTLAEAEFRAVA